VKAGVVPQVDDLVWPYLGSSLLDGLDNGLESPVKIVVKLLSYFLPAGLFYGIKLVLFRAAKKSSALDVDQLYGEVKAMVTPSLAKVAFM
jgi:hypothetical protein